MLAAFLIVIFYASKGLKCPAEQEIIWQNKSRQIAFPFSSKPMENSIILFLFQNFSLLLSSVLPFLASDCRGDEQVSSVSTMFSSLIFKISKIPFQRYRGTRSPPTTLHHLEHSTASKIQRGHQWAQKWLTTYGKRNNLRFRDPLINFCKISFSIR